MTRRPVLPLLLLAGAMVLGCSGGDGNDLDPGGSTIAGNVTQALTGTNTTVSGITVTVVGDGESSAVTTASGSFVVTDAPTGEVDLVLSRGACEASVPLDTISAQSNLDVVNLVFLCDIVEFDAIHESFEAILREDAFSRDEPLRTCVRVGANSRRRDVDAEAATIIDEDDDVTSIDNLFTGDRLAIDGDRDASGRAATFLAASVRVLETDADDPCAGQQ
jgi:hypothetical protein